VIVDLSTAKAITFEGLSKVVDALLELGIETDAFAVKDRQQYDEVGSIVLTRAKGFSGYFRGVPIQIKALIKETI
jgi:hypothetical protein